MTTEKAIINILEEQIGTYKTLHMLLRKERKCLLDFDAEKVEQISKEKDTVIMTLRLLEEERVRLVKQYAEDNDIDSNVTLDALGKLTGNTLFPDLRSQLLSLLQNIEEMNRFNSILIDRSLNYIQSTTNFFNLFKNENSPQSAGTLLSKET